MLKANVLYLGDYLKIDDGKSLQLKISALAAKNSNSQIEKKT